MEATLFEQAVSEVERFVSTAKDLPDSFDHWRVLDRLRDPDRVIRFTVRWLDDDERVQFTPAWRVQYCNALGPYKGGLRFSSDVSEDTFLFLGFEQCFKNALTGLPLGGGKGGAQFRTSEHSESEVVRFCQAFMDEYIRYSGEDEDIPAGDIGVGPREIGFLFGRFAKLTRRYTGTITGKPEELGGIPGRVESTGYGCVEFARLALEQHGKSIKDARIAISGAGNVAIHAAERAIACGARVLSLSNSKGTAVFGESGLSQDEFDKFKRRHEAGDRLEEIAKDTHGETFRYGERPWALKCDVAMPCATQNELDGPAAALLVDSGVSAVVEGANMPCTAEATERFCQGGVIVCPGKAANAGGVVVSGFEMMQNASRDPWKKPITLDRLYKTMAEIHDRCVAFGGDGDRVDYVRGANLAGFDRLGKAIVAAGPN